MVTPILTFCKEYYNEIPSDTLVKVGKSASISFTVYLIVVNSLISMRPIVENLNLKEPLLAAGIAGTASLIHGLTNPLFNRIFRGRLSFPQEMIKFYVNLTSVYLLFSRMTSFKTNLVGLCFFYTYPTNIFKCLFEFVPFFFGKLDQLSNPPSNNERWIRTIYSALGIEFNPNSNSSYYTLGI